MHPKAVAAMRHCYRPLLVFSPSAADRQFLEQERALDADADDMMDRNVLLIPLLTDAGGYKPPLDAPSDLLPAAEQNRLRLRYQVKAGRFHVVLLGEDGGAKLSSDRPLTTDRLNALIDTMPTRRHEMRQPHTN